MLPGGSVENFDVPRLSKLKNTCVTGAGWEFFSPHSWLWLNNRSGPTANKKFRQALMFAIDRNMAKDVVWNGSARSRPARRLGDQVLHRRGAEIRLRSGQGEGAAQGSRLQRREAPHAASALWRDVAALGRNGSPEPAGRRDQRRDGRDRRPRLESKSQRVGLRHRLYLSLSVWRSRARRRPQLCPSQIAKGSPFNNVEGYSNPEIDKLFADGAVAFPMRRAGRSTPRRRRSSSRTCRSRGCSNCNSRPSPAAASRTWSRPASA